MAQHYYGLDRGADAEVDEVTVGTSTGGTDVEIRVDDSKGLTKKDVRILLSTLTRRILDGRFAEFLGTGGV